MAGVVQPGDAAHAQLSSRKVTGGTATPTPVRPPPQEPHLELSEPVCSWDIKSGLGICTLYYTKHCLPEARVKEYYTSVLVAMEVRKARRPCYL